MPSCLVYPQRPEYLDLGLSLWGQVFEEMMFNLAHPLCEQERSLGYEQGLEFHIVSVPISKPSSSDWPRNVPGSCPMK